MTTAQRRHHLCLLPGLDGTGRLYAPLRAALGQAYLVSSLAYDNTRFDGYEALADALAPSLREHRDVVLVAESFAGPLAVTLAHRHPDRVGAIVLAASFVHQPLPFSTACASLLRYLPVIRPPTHVLEQVLAGSDLPASLSAEFARILSTLPIDMLRDRALAALRVDVRDQLASLDMPLLYLRARNDRLIRARAGREVVSLARNGRLVGLDAPHFLFQVAPDAAAAAIMEFLRSSDR